MTELDQIKSFLAKEKRRRYNIAQIERDAELPRSTLQQWLNEVKYRSLTKKQLEKLLPVLEGLGFKLKND